MTLPLNPAPLNPAPLNPAPLNPAMAATFLPPVMEARRWLDGIVFPPDRPLINVSQAAPVDPPPLALREAIARAALEDPAAHLYGPVLGLPALRAEVAGQWSRAYGGAVAPDQVAITQGCNQAFCAAVATLAGAGDQVILPTPWYFNHKMWLDMQGVAAVPLATGPTLMPDPDAAAALIGPRTRAIVLVSPNNPGGVEYPAALLRAFRDLARSRGIALILDETYRDFDSRTDGRGGAHDLFADPDWSDTLIQLYSFSKAYRLTGHRVGALVAGAARLAEVEKFLDTVAICPGQLGQIGALWGMRHLGDWVAGERDEILSRRAAMVQGFARLEDWRLLGCGAYFAYVEHPSAMPAPDLARRLVREAGVLTLPGTMFMPADDPAGARQLRIAFANIDRAGIAALFDRLSSLPV
ncbi:aminotransferase [Frigidibacter oleivorans]|uniref:aminotransferase n=1 Tax=Frigidibacter oleivorans TaxID=2487129 RepID=UPI000F8C8B84|nr:aminotransferase [Frigidibacter oleivorans]